MCAHVEKQFVSLCSPKIKVLIPLDLDHELYLNQIRDFILFYLLLPARLRSHNTCAVVVLIRTFIVRCKLFGKCWILKPVAPAGKGSLSLVSQ